MSKTENNNNDNKQDSVLPGDVNMDQLFQYYLKSKHDFTAKVVDVLKSYVEENESNKNKTIKQ